jgi:hypothetical protein
MATACSAGIGAQTEETAADRSAPVTPDYRDVATVGCALERTVVVGQSFEQSVVEELERRLAFDSYSLGDALVEAVVVAERENLANVVTILGRRVAAENLCDRLASHSYPVLDEFHTFGM